MKKIIIILIICLYLSIPITGMITKKVEYASPPVRFIPNNIKTITVYNGISSDYPFYDKINKEFLSIDHVMYEYLKMRFNIVSPAELNEFLSEKTSNEPAISGNEALKIFYQENNIDGIIKAQIFNYKLNNGKNFKNIMVRTKDVIIERLVTEKVYDEEEEKYVKKTFKREYSLEAYNIEISYSIVINLLDIESSEIILSKEKRVDKKYKYIPDKQFLDIVINKDYKFDYVSEKPDIHKNLVKNCSYIFQDILKEITPNKETSNIKFLKIPGYKNNDKLKNLIKKDEYNDVIDLLSKDEDFNDSSLKRLNQFGILFYNIGCAYEMLDEIKTAKKYYKKAYDHNKNLNIGKAYQRANERIKIEKELKKQEIKNIVKILN